MSSTLSTIITTVTTVRMVGILYREKDDIEMLPDTSGHYLSNYLNWFTYLGKIFFIMTLTNEEVIGVSLIKRSLSRAATSLNILEVIRPKYQIFQQKTRKLLSSCCNDSTLFKVDSDKDCAIELSTVTVGMR